MCKIFDWVFDSVTVEEAPQNHFVDDVQDGDVLNDDDESEDEQSDEIYFDGFGFLSVRFRYPIVHRAITSGMMNFLRVLVSLI